MVKQCPTCATHFSPRREPMIPSTLPQYPWQKIGVDLCHLKGHNYLIVAFSEFAENYSFQHATSSPYFAQSNGQVERKVQTVKRLLREASDSHLALMTYRSTPFPWCKLSPAELLMGRKIRTNIPLLQDQLIPEWNFLEGFCALNESFKRTQKETYDRQHGVRNLPPLSDNTEVWITSGEQMSGTVVRAADTPRSYIVDTPSGELRRNRHHLNIVLQSSPTSFGTSTTREPIITRSRAGKVIYTLTPTDSNHPEEREMWEWTPHIY